MTHQSRREVLPAGPAPARRARARRRPGRRAGLALIAWGIAGLALAVGSLVAVAGPLASLGDLSEQRTTAIRWLDLADQSLADAAISTRGAAQGLGTARTSTQSAAGLFSELATSLSALSAASAVSVFGAQPFAAASASLDRVAARSRELAGEMADLGGSLDAESADLGRLATDVDQLRTELAGLRVIAGTAGADRVAEAVRGLGLFGVLVALWLALPSVAAVGLGVDLARRSRAGRRAGLPPTSPSPGPATNDATVHRSPTAGGRP